MTMTEIQRAEFRAFCHRDGLSPSGTDTQLWEQARQHGMLAAVWAVHHGEVPDQAKIEELASLERYALPLLPGVDERAVRSAYLTANETADILHVTLSRVRQLADKERLFFIETEFGRLYAAASVTTQNLTARAGRPWPSVQKQQAEALAREALPLTALPTE